MTGTWLRVWGGVRRLVRVTGVGECASTGGTAIWRYTTRKPTLEWLGSFLKERAFGSKCQNLPAFCDSLAPAHVAHRQNKEDGKQYEEEDDATDPSNQAASHPLVTAQLAHGFFDFDVVFRHHRLGGHVPIRHVEDYHQVVKIIPVKPRPCAGA
jgi:hypothetical protein